MYFPDLLAEYKQLLADMRAQGVTNSSMYAEVKQAVEWMETGYDPAKYRAATRIDAYPMDLHLMKDLISYVDSEYFTPGYIFDHEGMVSRRDAEREINRMAKIKRDVKDAMQGLTDNERAVFVLIKCDLMSFSKAARVMGITKGTAQGYFRRAEQNIMKGSQQEFDLFVG